MSNHLPSYTVGEKGYLTSLQHILDYGFTVNKERTGTGTIVSPTPMQMYFPDVENKFPLFTTKKVSFNMLACEMLWFISGSTNTNDLREIGSDAMADMWDKWADEDGELGPVYGKQWREYQGFAGKREAGGDFPVITDQLQEAINTIKNKPTSRRIIVNAWNPIEIGSMALPPCHLMYQFTCEPIPEEEYYSKCLKDGLKGKETKQPYKLHLHLTQRSCDMFLGEN